MYLVAVEIKNMSMRSFYFIWFFLLACVQGIAQDPHQGCQNVDFHDGWSGWTGGTNFFSTKGGTCKGLDCVNGTYSHSTPTDVNRFKIISDSENDTDPIACFPMVRPGSEYSVRLGNAVNGAHTEQLIYDFVVDSTEPYFIYHSAFVLQNPGHEPYQQPFFDVRMYHITDTSMSLIPCSDVVYTAGAGLANVSTTTTYCDTNISIPNGQVQYRDWHSTNVDLSDYKGKTVRIVFTTADCSPSLHFGYAYIASECIKGAIQVISDGLVCKGRPIQLGMIGMGNYIGETYLWNFDGHPQPGANPVFVPSTGGPKEVSLTITLPGGGSCSTLVLNQTIVIPESCDHPSCTDCITSFSPMPGKRYLLSAWVREPLRDVTHTFLNTGIRITYNDGDSAMALFRPSGPIIDGWQRIEQSFTIPAYAYNIQVELVNESEGNDAFFDDIRIHPFQSNMKSFVYDPSTQLLVAELDENNYATYYEYDDEGILIRVKKETERGIMTIKESRNNQSKLFKD